MELWHGLTSGTRSRHITRVSKNRTVARIRYSRGGREASATSVKGASICTSDVIVRPRFYTLVTIRDWNVIETRAKTVLPILTLYDRTIFYTTYD
jgi:hypothetical protein